jgi:hypothetical protein
MSRLGPRARLTVTESLGAAARRTAPAPALSDPPPVP